MAQAQSSTHADSLGTHLLLAAGDHAVPWPVETAWRAAVPTTSGLAAPEEILRRSKPVALAARGERALLAALAADDGHAVMEQAARHGDHQLAAAVLAALRIADHIPDRGLGLLTWVRSSGHNPGTLRFIRRYLPNLVVFVRLAPRVQLWTQADASGLALLEAELLEGAGRPGEALAVRQTIPPGPLATFVRAVDAAGAGRHEEVVAVTEHVRPGDELASASLAWRGRSLQALGKGPAAMSLMSTLLESPGMSPGVRLVALKTQEEVLRSMGRDAEAELTAGEWSALRDELQPGGPGPAAANLGPVAPSADAGETGSVPDEAAPGGEETDVPAVPADEDAAPGDEAADEPLAGRSLAVAIEDGQARVRRQLRWSDTPGMLGGRHQADFVEEVDELIAGGHVQAAESLLLALLDAIDEAVDEGQPLDETHFITLAGLFSSQGLLPEELATLDRLLDAFRRAGVQAPEAVVRQRSSVEAALSGRTAG